MPKLTGKNDPLAAAEERLDKAAAEAFRKAGVFRDSWVAKRRWDSVGRRAKELRESLEKFQQELSRWEEVSIANSPTSDHLNDR